jgi:hypothetical protein
MLLRQKTRFWGHLPKTMRNDGTDSAEDTLYVGAQALPPPTGGGRAEEIQD